MINFENFKSTLTNYFNNYIARNESDAAKFIANTYETFILSGMDLFFNNRVISYNKEFLRSSIENALLVSRASFEFNNTFFETRP